MEGGDGKLCVYVLQEEALQAGGNTRASISNVCPNKCVYVCVLCMIVTGGVYFGSVHRLRAKTNNTKSCRADRRHVQSQ